jgi:hypothetical protein
MLWAPVVDSPSTSSELLQWTHLPPALMPLLVVALLQRVLSLHLLLLLGSGVH